MQTIKQSYEIKCPLEKAWQALVDPKEIDRWGGGPAIMDDKVGTNFRLWRGDIHGTNKEVVNGQRLVQEWFGGEWAQPSIVTFLLSSQQPGITRIDLVHENIPDEEVKNINSGWDLYYLGAMKKYLESPPRRLRGVIRL